MSSNNNNDANAGIAIVLGVIGAAFMMMAVVFVLLMLFHAFVLTIVAIFAWN